MPTHTRGPCQAPRASPSPAQVSASLRGADSPPEECQCTASPQGASSSPTSLTQADPTQTEPHVAQTPQSPELGTRRALGFMAVGSQE